MNNLNLMVSNFSNLKEFTNKVTETILNNGIEKNRKNLNTFLTNENFQSLKDREIKNIQAITNSYKNYDTTFQSMIETVEEIKVKSIQYNSNINNQEFIQVEFPAFIENIKNLENTKDYSGKNIFQDSESNLLIGNNQKVVYKYDKSIISINDNLISEELENILNVSVNDEINLDSLDNILNELGQNLANIGIRQSYLQKTETFYNNLKLNQEEFYQNQGELEENIQLLNESVLTYEALRKITNTMNQMSLVNYM